MCFPDHEFVVHGDTGILHKAGQMFVTYISLPTTLYAAIKQQTGKSMTCLTSSRYNNLPPAVPHKINPLNNSTFGLKASKKCTVETLSCLPIKI